MVAARPRANVSSLASIEIGVCNTPYAISKQFFTKVWINEAVQVKVMLDSGSAGNFISPKVVQRCGLNTQPRETPLSVTHIQGGKVGLVTEQVRCQMHKGNHSEYITFNVVPLGKHAIIIGMPWLQVHNLCMDWEKCKVSFKLKFCMENCITITSKDLEELEIMEISAIGKEEMDIVPPELHSQLPGFDIEKARKMPETKLPYNFTIQLMEGKELPQFSKPYQLMPAQMEEAKKQIEESEQCRMISPLKSCIVAPLFFVPKKDGTQRMCIDYQALNEITIKDAYPLPNMEALLKSARGATIFSKLDLRLAYNMILIEPAD